MVRSSRVLPADARRVVAQGGFGYLEGARWNRGALWFSDMTRRKICRLSPGEEPEDVAEVPGRPSGLGFGPDGAPMVVSIEDGRLLRVGSGGLDELADLAPVAFHPNDMAVDREGRAYIGPQGYVFGSDPVGVGLIIRHPDGRIDTGGEDLIFPNGIAISGDGSTLIVAESFRAPRARLTAFTVTDEGALVDQRVFAEFGSPDTETIDGICIDSEGAVWAAFPWIGEFRRVREGGEVTDVIQIEPDTAAYPNGGTFAVDSVLGGPQMRTLYLLISDTSPERLGNSFDATGRIEAIEVEVAGIRD
ncbi:SMP-30/gluconolactonase/LRE family protein [Streptomonospora salina]|uniref:Sugar lactone lactonase YvrE n=1 Tax=Streptomonospora salina TaxID=104205 RepID=A0A841EKZ7_9ACTN|nr:SMP-30/gluconolactonase/LRE family protein [Streptomonospora salina]MBB6000081.1 sugar lactone lactonase YvrE [Streptomonospora salina]